MSEPVEPRPWQDLTEGMEVVSSDNRLLGYVRGLRESEFLLCRPGDPVVLIPYTAIGAVSSSLVTLDAPGAAAAAMGWAVIQAMPMPPSSLKG